MAKKRDGIIPVEWAERAKIVKSDISTRRTWKSLCGKYVLEEVKFHSPVFPAPSWRVIEVGNNGGQFVITTNRTRLAAERALKERMQGIK